MRWTNSPSTYGLLHIALHWLSALLVFGLFGLGLWMVDLTYYDTWYRQAPLLHKGFGVILTIFTLLRLLHLALYGKPRALANHKFWEQLSAKIGHVLLYLLLCALPISGYLISTADGRALSVFDAFSIPAVFADGVISEDLAGQVHEILAYSLIVLATLHALAALKHQFIDKDSTLKRMLSSKP